MEKIELFVKKKEYVLFFILISILFTLRVLFFYSNYLDYTKKDLVKKEALILNIYEKSDYFILKLKVNQQIIYTKTKTNFLKFDIINLFLITKNLSFINYLRGNFQNSFYLIKKLESSKQKNNKYLLDSIHKNKDISSLYQTLYFGTSLEKELRDFVNNWGFAHLFAISGFHLGIILLIIMILLNKPYAFFQNKYFPYRNRKNDLILLSMFVIFNYLIYIDFVASFLRAFVMFVLVYIFSRANIKVVSFKTLVLTFLIIVTIFPMYLFSLSLWFSLIAVFYIFLYLKYIDIKSKILSLIFFNIWIFFVFNPIVHFYFPTTSYEQLLSPVFTIIFSFFYPFSVFLHLIGEGELLDEILKRLIDYKVHTYEFKTTLYFFIIYIGVSFVSIFKKRAFILLNALFFIYNLLLFIK